MFDFRPTVMAVLRCRPENLHRAFIIQRLSLRGKEYLMSGNLIRFGITIVSVLILVSSILVVRAHFGASGTGKSAATAIEQASALEIAAASTSDQQNAVGTEHFFPPASRAFEPLLLLLLGSILLFIGTAIKMLLTRKLKQR